MLGETPINLFSVQDNWKICHHLKEYILAQHLVIYPGVQISFFESHSAISFFHSTKKSWNSSSPNHPGGTRQQKKVNQEFFFLSPDLRHCLSLSARSCSHSPSKELYPPQHTFFLALNYVSFIFLKAVHNLVLSTFMNK